MCAEKLGVRRKETKQSRCSEVHQDGQDISMATTGCYRWTGHLSQTGRDRRLLKMTWIWHYHTDWGQNMRSDCDWNLWCFYFKRSPLAPYKSKKLHTADANIKSDFLKRDSFIPDGQTINSCLIVTPTFHRPLWWLISSKHLDHRCKT